MTISYPAYKKTNWNGILRGYIDNGAPAVDGAIADGIADDTAAVLAAAAAGSVDWGGPGNVYRITSPLALTLAADTVWISHGAKIILDVPAPVQRAVSITLAGHAFRQIGSLTIDAKDLAYQGFYGINNTATLVDLVLDRLTVQNVRRSGSSFSGGDGIYLEGSFGRCSLIRPTVRSVRMAAGTHTVGVQGVTGITVKASSATNYFRKLEILSPLIDSVYAEDATDLADQDGIRVMAAEDNTAVTNVPYPSSVVITDGEFRDCCGRAVKSQTELTTVRDARIYRTRTRYLADGVTPVRGGTDIDFQVGGGILDGLYAEYTNDAPVIVVSCTGPATATKVVPRSSVSRVKVTTAGTVSPQVIVQSGLRSELVSIFRVDDVEAVGTQPDTMLIINGAAGARVDAMLSRIVGAPTLAGGQSGFIMPRIDGWAGGHLYLEKMINTGAAPIRMIGSASLNVNPNLEISARDCYGFLATQKALDAGRFVDGPIARVDALGPTGVIKAGVIRPAATTLADGATWKLPASFLTSYTGLLLVSVDGDANGQGLFSVSPAGVVQLAAGSGFAVGTTAEPAAGTYRLWSSATGPSISNRSGASHTITALMFG